MAEGKGGNNPGFGGLLDRIVTTGLDLGTDIAKARLLPTSPTFVNPGIPAGRSGEPPTVVRNGTGFSFDSQTVTILIVGAVVLVAGIAIMR